MENLMFFAATDEGTFFALFIVIMFVFFFIAIFDPLNRRGGKF